MPDTSPNPDGGPTPSLRERAVELLPLTLAFAPVLLGAGNQIQEVDPAQYAEVSRRMFESGDWAHLHDAFGPFLNKPPFTFWLMCGSFKLFGLTNFAVRFPTMVLGALLLWLTLRIGAQLFDRRTGVWGAAMLGASPAFQLMVADPKVDMPVTTLIAAELWLMLEARRRPWMAYLAWLAAGLAVLSKGPIGLVVPVLAIAPEALRRRWGARPDQPPGTLWERLRPLKPVAGPLLLLLVVVPWYRENARQFGSAGPLLHLWHQGLGRLLDRDFIRNDTTPLYFLHTALWAYLPFSPIFALELFRRARALLRERRFPHDESRVLLWWFAIPFVAVSLASFKLPQYCYWMAPAAALISARALLAAKIPARPLAITQGAVAALVVALVAALLVLCFPPAQTAATAGWLALAAGLAVAGWVLARRAPEPALRPMVIGLFALTAFNAVFHGHVHRALLEFQPDQAFGQLARQVDPDGTVIARLGPPDTQAVAFYARRDVVNMTPAEMRDAAAAGRARLALVTEEKLPELAAAGLTAQPLLWRPQFLTSKPTGTFLLQRTRPRTLMRVALVEIKPTPTR